MSSAEFTNGLSTPEHNTWFLAGLTSSFPDIALLAQSAPATGSQKIRLSDPVPCTRDEINTTQKAACKIFRVTDAAISTSKPTAELTSDEALATVGLEEQVMVFQRRGKFHAVDHRCPHRSYPLSRGSTYDIEDFGIVLSAGIMCPKHGWAFDLYTGESDRGAYKLHIWDVEVRERAWSQLETETQEDVVKEVWVKKR